MSKRNIIVIGTSAGGFEALKTIVAGLPADLDASIFIVWHMAPDVTGILPQVLNKYGQLDAANARDGEAIMPGRIYVSPPDQHLLIDDGYVRVTHGPKENRFRPAVDPLFRSAAYTYGSRVIGVVLTGALDDGTSGLWTIKEAGGLAVVQNPADAEVSSMPENALAAVAVDYCLPASEIAGLLVTLSQETAPQITNSMKQTARTKAEIDSAAEDSEAALALFKSGKLTPYTCPDCGGVLAQLQEGGRSRFRCHTGHAFSSDALLVAVSEQIEHGFYSAIRRVDEGVMLLNHLGDHFAEDNDPKLAALYFKKAKEAQTRADLVRRAVQAHEQMSKNSMKTEAAADNENTHEAQ